jgi:LexA-binding, inner membrane-associated putative hydrolase
VHPYRGWPFLSDLHHPILSAVWAVFVHGVLGVLVVLPIVWRSRRRALFIPLAFVGGSALDLDHVVAAGSLDPRKLEDLDHRPDPHSLLFVLALALLAWTLTRRKVFAWCVFAVNTGHLLFDAAGEGVYWLYPLKRPDGIPWLACPIGIVVLTGISVMVARARAPTVGPIEHSALPASPALEPASPD